MPACWPTTAAHSRLPPSQLGQPAFAPSTAAPKGEAVVERHVKGDSERPFMAGLRLWPGRLGHCVAEPLRTKGTVTLESKTLHSIYLS